MSYGTSIRNTLLTYFCIKCVLLTYLPTNLLTCLLTYCCIKYIALGLKIVVDIGSGPWKHLLTYLCIQ